MTTPTHLTNEKQRKTILDGIEASDRKEHDFRDASKLQIQYDEKTESYSFLGEMQRYYWILDKRMDSWFYSTPAPNANVSFNDVEPNQSTLWRTVVNAVLSTGAGVAASTAAQQALDTVDASNPYTKFIPGTSLVTKTVSVLVGSLTTKIVAACLPNGDAMVNGMEENILRFYQNQLTKEQQKLLETLAHLQMRFVIYLERNSVPDEEVINGIINSYGQAVAALTNTLTTQERGIQDAIKAFFGDEQAVQALSPHVLQKRIYEMFASVCDAASTSVADNPTARVFNYLGDWVRQRGIIIKILAIPFRILGELFEYFNWPIVQRFNRPKRELLRNLSHTFHNVALSVEREGHKRTVSNMEFRGELDRLIPVAKERLFSDKMVFAGAAETWITEYKCRYDMAEAKNDAHPLREPIDTMLELYAKQMEQLVADPRKIDVVIQQTQLYIVSEITGSVSTPSAAQLKQFDKLEYLNKVRVQVLQLVHLIIQKQQMPDFHGQQYDFTQLRGFFVRKLQGSAEVFDLAANPMIDERNFASVAEQLAYMLENRKREIAPTILTGSAMIWSIFDKGVLANEANNLLKQIDHTNIDKVIADSLNVYDHLAIKHPSLARFYHFILIKQLAEIWYAHRNGYVCDEIKKVLKDIFNVEERYFDDLAEMQYGQVTDIKNLFLYLSAILPTVQVRPTPRASEASVPTVVPLAAEMKAAADFLLGPFRHKAVLTDRCVEERSLCDTWMRVTETMRALPPGVEDSVASWTVVAGDDEDDTESIDADDEQGKEPPVLERLRSHNPARDGDIRRLVM